MSISNDSLLLLCPGSSHSLDALPAYPVRPSSQIAGSRPQHSLFRQERTASCKTAALAESNGSGARMIGATDGGSRVQPAGGYTGESLSVRQSNFMTDGRRTRRRWGYEGKSTRTTSA